MPTTEFARMHRTDHSMLPPAPAATIAFKSPNACNLCHKDKTPQWADEWVRKWRKRDYQAAVLQRAGLIAAARRGDWSKLPEILDYVTSKDRDEIFATSLIRLFPTSADPRVVPVLLKAIKGLLTARTCCNRSSSAKRSYERICAGSGRGGRG